MRGLEFSDTATLLTRPRGILALSAVLYLAAALHAVILAPLGWPSMEVLWSALLIPTLALSFYYGWRGAFGSVAFALVLFVAIEWLSHGSAAFIGDRLMFAASVFIAIVTLGVATGGLAELLRGEHFGRLTAERRAATSEMAIALRHEINNPLAALLMEAELLEQEKAAFPQDQQQSIDNMLGLARRIQELVDRVAVIDEPRRVEYVRGKWMIDLSED